LWLRESRLRIRNGNNPKLSTNKENPSKNEQTRSSTDHILFLIKDRFMLGEEDGLLDDFLGDVHSVHHIAAVPRRQIRHACACAIARRRRIANACQSATGIRLRQLPIAPDKPRLTRPAAHITILAVAALTPACRCHFITPRHAQHGSREHAAGSRLVRGSASPPRPGFGQSKAIRTSSALR
jgi:hypothetical protein